MPSKLDQLKAMTDVVADTGDIEAIARFEPQDATTNPSLLLKAAALPSYRALIEDARSFAANADGRQEDALCDRFAVLIGKEIAGIVPGRVSTEVDARLSFDTQATIARAQKIIDAYETLGVGRERILIKIASTWEGIEAAAQLERENINCNLTLLFGFEQAVACAHAGVTLISPFVGRILDWYKATTGQEYDAESDPGVASVRRIYAYYKAHRFATIVMGASFRNAGEIEALAGCDRLTISPDLLAELAADEAELPRRLDPRGAESADPNEPMPEASFRWQHNENAMATEKLAEGIRKFAADQVTLETQLAGG
ncbi:MAG: transaldolase [Pseudomonadota bacterium]